jgi:hypothetical protein
MDTTSTFKPLWGGRHVFTTAHSARSASLSALSASAPESSCTYSSPWSSPSVFNGGSLLLFSCLKSFLRLHPSNEADPAVPGLSPLDDWRPQDRKNWPAGRAKEMSETHPAQFGLMNRNKSGSRARGISLNQLKSFSELLFLTLSVESGAFCQFLTVFPRSNRQHLMPSLDGVHPTFMLYSARISSSLFFLQNSIPPSGSCSMYLLQEICKSVYSTNGFFAPNSLYW